MDSIEGIGYLADVAVLREVAIGLDGDLDLVNGDLRIASGPEAVAQRVAVRLRTFRGEWIFDQLLGTPWIQQILGKSPNLQLISGILRRRILQSQGVSSLQTFSVRFDRSSRQLVVTGRGRTDDSQTIDLESALEVAI